jgi:hypothetical protein
VLRSPGGKNRNAARLNGTASLFAWRILMIAETTPSRHPRHERGRGDGVLTAWRFVSGIPALGCGLRAAMVDRAAAMTVGAGLAVAPDRTLVAADHGVHARLAFLTTLGVTADAIIIGSVRNQPGDDRPNGDDCHGEDRSRRPVTQGCKSPLTATPSTSDLDYMCYGSPRPGVAGSPPTR